MERTYVRIRSWHVVAEADESAVLTRCGRTVTASDARADAIPPDEKSCESCLRLTVLDDARPEAGS